MTEVISVESPREIGGNKVFISRQLFIAIQSIFLDKKLYSEKIEP